MDLRGSKWMEAGGYCIIKELHSCFYSRHIIGVIKSVRMDCERHVARVEEMKNAFRIVVGSMGVRTRRRLEEDIRMRLKKIGLEDMNGIHVAQDQGQSRH